MKKAYSLLICASLFSSMAFADEPVATTTAGEAFVTLTRTDLRPQDLPTNTEIIDAPEIKRYNAVDAGQAVQHATSVQTLPLGGTGSLATVRIRGSLSSQTLVLIDGRPASGYELGPADLSEIPVESIDHIEIVRGGASALYGPNAMGGVINVITKRGTGKTTADLNAQVGSYDDQQLRFSGGSRYDTIDYFLYGDADRNSGFRNNSDAKILNLGGNVGIPFPAGKLVVRASTLHNEIGLPGFIFPEIPPNRFNNDVEKIATSPRARQETIRRTLQADYAVPLPLNTALALKAYGTERSIDSVDPDNFENGIRHEQSKGVDAQVSLPYGGLVGGNFVRDREDNTDRLTVTNSFTHAVEQWGVFVQDTFNWRTLSLTAGGRHDHNSIAGESNNPRVLLTDDLTPWLKFSGSVARSFRAPSIDDLFFVFGGLFPFNGNPNLRPEKAWTYDTGLEAHDETASVRVSYFRANITDLIQVDPITFATVVNIGEARRQGIEIEGHQIISNQLQQSVNYTYLSNKGIPAGASDFVTLAYSPLNTANHTLTWTPNKTWTFDLITRYVDSRYSGNDKTGNKLGSQVTWDTRMGYTLSHTELYFGVQDLFNKRYEEQAGFPLPGRTFYGGAQWHFE
jgi:outer membrane cobalamin receptor